LLEEEFAEPPEVDEGPVVGVLVAWLVWIEALDDALVELDTELDTELLELITLVVSVELVVS
jgi:hypothetical protein